MPTALSATAWRRAAFAMFAVGWASNHFVPLLPVYRRALGLSDASLTAIFAVYALGLAPGLLLGGPASDRYGRRPLMLIFTGLSLVATGVLITGVWGPAALFVGRFLTGVVSGVVFAVGTAWVKELSTHAGPGTGARRAAISLSGGFGSGPLGSGILAQWAPRPEIVPYLVPLLLAGIALLALLGTPETMEHRTMGEKLANPFRVPARARPRFGHIVLPMAPWVFGSIGTVFAIMPALVHTAGLASIIAGVLAAVTLTSGIVIQPVARRLDGTGAANGAVIGLLTIVLGYVTVAVVANTGSLAVAFLAAVVLGAGYGICLVSGLLEVERLAHPEDLAGLVAIYYTLAYFGLAVPYVISLIAPVAGVVAGVLVASGLAVASAAEIWWYGRGRA